MAFSLPGMSMAQGGRARARLLSVAAMLLALAYQARAEEEEEKMDPVTIAVSIMLLGSITFQMSLFYLTNYPDPDIQRYSYQVIGNTISIFSAVLVFQGVNGVIEEQIIKKYEDYELTIDFCTSIFFFLLLQLVTAVICKITDTEHNWGTVNLNLKCFATMMAHMTGFATINAFTTLQERYIFAESWYCAMLIVPFLFVSVSAAFTFSDWVREKWTMADGKRDECEIIWDEETEEAENDVIGLALSFTTIQACRFATEGSMPTKEGSHTGPQDELLRQAFYLVLVACFWGAVVAGFQGWMSKQEFSKKMRTRLEIDVEKEKKGLGEALLGEDEAEEAEDPWEERKKRYASVFQTYGVMCFAWSSMFWPRLLLKYSQWFPGNHATILSKVCLALLLSFGSFAVIFLLDKIADSEATGRAADKIIGRIIEAKALVIGFSWEGAFDSAVEEVADTKAMQATPLSPAVTKLFLSLLLAAIVVPAYKKHILPKVIELEEKQEEKEELEDEAMMEEEEKEAYKKRSLPTIPEFQSEEAKEEKVQKEEKEEAEGLNAKM